jgi:Leucine-rich repeat (LRR) protein
VILLGSPLRFAVLLTRRTSWQGGIKTLKSLELCYSGVRDSHLIKLTHLPALEELNLDSCLVGDGAISHLADGNVVPNLKSLDLADTDLTDLGMVHIAKFKNLTRLSLFYCNITNRGLRHLANLTQLEALNLDSREIGDDGLWHLRHLEKLKSLDIFSGRVTDSGCAHIAKIKSLDSLELCGGGVGDLGCTLLATLENLTSLNLSQNERITNRGAAALAILTNLKTLNLSHSQVNSHALCYFSGLLKLQSLALYGCTGIDENNGLDRLQNGLPNLKCLRMNTVSPDDGVIMQTDNDSDDGDEDDLDSDSDSDMVVTSRRPPVPAFQNSDSSDDDSEMDDEDDVSADDDSSYSDHD